MCCTTHTCPHTCGPRPGDGEGEGDEPTLGAPVPDGPRVRHPDRPHIAGTAFLRAADVASGDVVHHQGRWRLVVAVATLDDPLHPDSGDGIEAWQCGSVNEHLAEHRSTVGLMLAPEGKARTPELFAPSWHEPVRVQVWVQPDGTAGPLPTA